MSDAANALADDYREVIDEALDFVENATPEQWEAVTSEEGWTVAATLHHIARGNETVAGWLELFRSGQPVEGTMDEQDLENAAHAAEFAKADRLGTLEYLRSSASDTETLIRSLTDEELAKSAAFGFAERDLTCEQAAQVAVSHARTHLDSALSAAGLSLAG